MFLIDETPVEASNDAPANEISSQTTGPAAGGPAAGGKMSIEERRKALRAERLRKQQEMEALLAQEEELLDAAEGGITAVMACHL